MIPQLRTTGLGRLRDELVASGHNQPKMLVDSMQANCCHSSLPRSLSEAAPSCHGFQSIVVEGFALSVRMDRRHAGSNSSGARWTSI